MRSERITMPVIVFLFSTGALAHNEVEPSPDPSANVISVLTNECGLGDAGKSLLDGAIPGREQELEQSTQRAIAALLEEVRRKLWSLVNELKTEQWYLGELTSNPDTAPDLIMKQYLRIQILCSFVVETTLEARLRLSQLLRGVPAPSRKQLHL